MTSDALKDYIRENIYNNAITRKDLIECTTGFNYLDELTREERIELIKMSTEHWNSLATEEQAKAVVDFEARIREKKREGGGLMQFMNNVEVLGEMINVDLEEHRQGAIEEADQHNNLLLAEKLRKLRSADSIKYKLETGNNLV